jgi:hypothetical protein
MVHIRVDQKIKPRAVKATRASDHGVESRLGKRSKSPADLFEDPGIRPGANSRNWGAVQAPRQTRSKTRPRAGNDMSKLREVILLLAEANLLPARFRDQERFCGVGGAFRGWSFQR